MQMMSVRTCLQRGLCLISVQWHKGRRENIAALQEMPENVCTVVRDYNTGELEEPHSTPRRVIVGTDTWDIPGIFGMVRA